MRRILIAIAALAIALASCKREAQKAGELETFKLKKVADFTSREDIGVVLEATISPPERIFFFEAGRGLIFGLSLSSPQKMVQIGKKGEGPGEYAGLSSIYAEDGKLFALDSKSKILVYSYEGKLLFEQKFKTDLRWGKFVGKLGEEMLFHSIHFKDLVNPYLVLYEWKEGEDPKKLMELPAVAEIKKREVKGKVMFQIFFLSFPTYALVDGNLLYSASSSYSLHLRSPDGKTIWEASLKAPPAEVPPFLRKFWKKSKKKFYPVITAFQCRERICVLSNYYKDDKPRLDVFSMQGKFLRSYLFPLKIERPVTYPIRVQGEYLLYFPNGEEGTGFVLYRLPEDI